jgi:hypothetical protein
MRHAIIVVGSEKQLEEPGPEVVLRDNEAIRWSEWFAYTNQKESTQLLDDIGSAIVRVLIAPLLAYRFYQLIHNTKLWSGKRPLVLVRGRSFASLVAAYAGTWGGGDVVKADLNDHPPLGPTRFVLDAEGKLHRCD